MADTEAEARLRAKLLARLWRLPSEAQERVVREVIEASLDDPEFMTFLAAAGIKAYAAGRRRRRLIDVLTVGALKHHRDQGL